MAADAFPSLPSLLLPLLLGHATAMQDGSAAAYAEAEAAAAVLPNATLYLNLLTEANARTGAACLDGSPGAYYMRKGVGSGVSKWYIHHMGGGWCESLDDCHRRSFQQTGTSKHYGPTNAMGSGYFSPLPSENPMMYNWNIVYLMYCDGGSFSGDNATVVVHKGRPLHFRGKRIREAAYASLLKTKKLNSATDVVISGCSAGGLATYLHVDQWCDALAADAPAAKCVGMPDSGFFLDYQSPKVGPADGARDIARQSPREVPREILREAAPERETASRQLDTARTQVQVGTTIAGKYHSGLRWAFEMFNATSGVNQDCITAHASGGAWPDDPTYLCFFAEHTVPYTHTPIFALQSEYDSWQQMYVVAKGESVQTLGDNITRLMYANSLGPHRQNGAFLDSCSHHCGSWNAITIDGEQVSTAFAKWYESLGTPRTKRVWRQAKPFPCKSCCTP